MRISPLRKRPVWRRRLWSSAKSNCTGFFAGVPSLASLSLSALSFPLMCAVWPSLCPVPSKETIPPSAGAVHQNVAHHLSCYREEVGAVFPIGNGYVDQPVGGELEKRP